jgi:hypothetical protein
MAFNGNQLTNVVASDLSDVPGPIRSIFANLVGQYGLRYLQTCLDIVSRQCKYLCSGPLRVQLICASYVDVPSNDNEVCAIVAQPKLVSGTPKSTDSARSSACYPCPWCGTQFKRAFELIRHVKQTVIKFVCSDCSQEFKREDKFKKHHQEAHHRDQRCSDAHASSAIVHLRHRNVLCCGFRYCQYLRPFSTEHDLNHFVHHLISEHYKCGAIHRDWSTTTPEYVHKLLDQPHIRPHWLEVTDSFEPYQDIPTMDWSHPVAEALIKRLEYPVDVSELRSILAGLYQAGLFNQGFCVDVGSSQGDRGQQIPLDLPSDFNEDFGGAMLTTFGDQTTRHGIDAGPTVASSSSSTFTLVDRSHQDWNAMESIAMDDFVLPGLELETGNHVTDFESTVVDEKFFESPFSDHVVLGSTPGYGVDAFGLPLAPPSWESESMAAMQPVVHRPNPSTQHAFSVNAPPPVPTQAVGHRRSLSGKIAKFLLHH